MTLPGQRLRISHGSTLESEPTTALQALGAQLDFQHADAVILFVSSTYDLIRLGKAIAACTQAPILCCTTAGELSSQHGYFQGGIAAATLQGCKARIISQVRLGATAETYSLTAEDSEFAVAAEEHDERVIGLFVADGLCRKEEAIIDSLQNDLPTVSIVGGSAGDACQFQETYIFHDGAFHRDGFALLLIRGGFAAIPFQTHHFGPSGIRVVATRVDPDKRRVLELDGVPAVSRLAQHLGMEPGKLTVDSLFTRPLLARYGESFFARAIQSVDADGGLTLYCAIQAGEVLHIGNIAARLVDQTSTYFDALRHQRSVPDLVIGFDCILRRLELQKCGALEEMNAVLRETPFIGFSTYGEQLDGMHINQTMTGVALWEASL